MGCSEWNENSVAYFSGFTAISSYCKLSNYASDIYVRMCLQNGSKCSALWWKTCLPFLGEKHFLLLGSHYCHGSCLCVKFWANTSPVCASSNSRLLTRKWHLNFFRTSLIRTPRTPVALSLHSNNVLPLVHSMLGLAPSCLVIQGGNRSWNKI